MLVRINSWVRGFAAFVVAALGEVGRRNQVAGVVEDSHLNGHHEAHEAHEGTKESSLLRKFVGDCSLLSAYWAPTVLARTRLRQATCAKATVAEGLRRASAAPAERIQEGSDFDVTFNPSESCEWQRSLHGIHALHTIAIQLRRGRLAVVPYRIEYSPDAERHLQSLSARQRSVVFDTVDTQLIFEPSVETRNRKPMRPNPIAPWELRIEQLRVYYDVQSEGECVVKIRAIGTKVRNRVRIGGEVVEL